MVSSDSAILLQAEHLRRSFGSGNAAVAAVNDVSISVYEGELLVLLGSSGSGKSTLLNLLGGLDRPDGGSIRIGGLDLCALKERELTDFRRESVGFVFQNFNLIPELTARENVALVCRNAADADEMLKAVGLSERADAYPAQMSGGEQQRVSIARALVRKPKLLLCDEPTGALDYETGRRILRLIELCCRTNGQTVVFVTHTKEIGSMADRVLTMRSGRLVKETVNPSPVPAREIEW